MRALVRPGASGPDAVADLERKLARLGVGDVVILAGGDCADQLAAMAQGIAGRTMIVDGDLIVAEASLSQLVDDPAVRSGALVMPVAPVAPPRPDPDPAPGRAPDPATPEESGSAGRAGSFGGDRADGDVASARIAQKRIVSAGSAIHQVSGPNAAFLGALVIDSRDAAAAADALAGAAEAARALGWSGDAVDVGLVSLVRAQVPMGAVVSVGPVLRGASARRAEVTAELADLDEARVLLERANRPDDGFYSTFVLRRASKPVTALALRLGMSPNQISLISLAVGLAAALCFATGSWWGLLAGALLMQASLVIDCVDGEVARFTRSFSDLGAWIDASTDRVKEYAAYAGLAAGSLRSGTDIWLLAALVMIMQTVRHVGDYDFSRVQRIRESWVPPRAIEDPADGGTFGTGATLELSAQLNRDSRVRWGKKVLHMPIGERWLILSVGAVTIGPRWTLSLMLLLGLIALAYTTTGRTLRSRGWHQPPDRSGSWLLEPQLDLGALGQPIWDRLLAPRQPLAKAFGWAWLAAMRAVELGVVWVAAALVIPDDGAWLFTWVFVVAFHHYDTLYRALGGSSPPRWLVVAGLGWDGRTILVLAAAVVGASALAGMLSWGSLALGLLFVVIGSVQWVRSMTGNDVAHA